MKLPRIYEEGPRWLKPIAKLQEIVHLLMPETKDQQFIEAPQFYIIAKRRHWVIASIMALCIYGAAFALQQWPSHAWLLDNPPITLGKLLDAVTGSQLPSQAIGYAILAGALVLMWYLWIQMPPKFPRKSSSTPEQPGQQNHETLQRASFMERIVTAEECVFRQGAEDWSPLQRTRACLAFSLSHVALFIFPYGMAVAHFIMGIIFMAEYLRVFRRTSSRHAAITASGSLHYATNLATFYALPVFLATQLLQLLLSR